VEATFVAGAVAREGALALWGPGADTGAGARIELVLPDGGAVAPRAVDVELVPVGSCIDALARLPASAEVRPSVRAWAVATNLALDLVARGRLVPSITGEGVDVWRVGPLDPDDVRRLDELARALPAAAHAVQEPGSAELRIEAPRAAVARFVDAVADAFVRTASAPVAAGHDAFAGGGRSDVSAWSEWLVTTTTSTGASAALRLELSEQPGEPVRGRLELRSALDPGLVMAAGDLWSAPTAVLARFGADAEASLLVTLRRAARVWPPLGRLLSEARPDVVDLADDEAEELFGTVADDLAAAGLPVLWPAEVLRPLTLRSVVTTPTPDAVAPSGLDLSTIGELRWRAAVDGEDLTEEDLAVLAAAKRPWCGCAAAGCGPTPASSGDWRSGERCAPVTSSPRRCPGRSPSTGRRWRRRSRGRSWRWRSASAPEPTPASGTPGGRAVRPDGPGGDAPALPAAGRRVARGDGRAGPRRGAGGRHGAGQDDPGARAPPRPSRAGADVGRVPDDAARQLGAGGGPLRPRHPRPAPPRGGAIARRGGRRRAGGDHLRGGAPGRSALATVGWGLVVADEAQAVKNPFSRTARSLRSLHPGARIALTGTPVENRLSDLWALLDWTTPGLLGPLDDFSRTVAVPIERDQDEDATARLAATVRPFLLRRRKTDPDIAPDLPPKTETDRFVGLTTEQATLYRAVADELLDDVAGADGIERRGKVLKLLTALKQICNHPAQYLGQDGPLSGRSGKLDTAVDLLQVIGDEGDSALVFTQYVTMGRLIVAALDAVGIRSAFLHGSVPVGRRQAMVDEFQAGPARGAGAVAEGRGTGLNLTRATHVLHYDRWWNPAVEDQASDRAWRIGQDRPVQVHRLLCEGTLEERIGVLLERKRALADAVVGGGEAWVSSCPTTSSPASSHSVARDAGRS
jgi:hypothetical protein